MKTTLMILSFLTLTLAQGQPFEKTFEITSRYLNIPTQMSRDRVQTLFSFSNGEQSKAVIRIANDATDYWVFKDLSEYHGQTLTLSFDENVPGIDNIYLSDRFAGQDSLYQETNRPQFHFTTQRGWNNDPNGLVWHQGVYHLFYQHNPYEIHWQNMTWGHATSPDLLHWQEHPSALVPDELGTMFSGSAIIDKNNTAGWGKDALVAAYTAHASDRETQCLAYSLDNGKSFVKYENNPVIDSKEKWDDGNTRDPKVFWYKANSEWVMALFESEGISIYTSKDLKTWTVQSHVSGFWECPELFELPVDGDSDNTRWVMYGASGTYLIGQFDGRTFTPQAGKYRTTYGKTYAAQTYNNTPDGRRIQIGWGRIKHPGMPFNQMMLFPTRLELRSTREGIRLFSNPVKEIAELHQKKHTWQNLNLAEANKKLKTIDYDLLHFKARVEIPKGMWFNLSWRGNKLITYDGNQDMMNGHPFLRKNLTSMTFDFEILIDRTSAEIFFDDGRTVFVNQLTAKEPENNLHFESSKDQLILYNFEIMELKSIW